MTIFYVFEFFSFSFLIFFLFFFSLITMVLSPGESKQKVSAQEFCHVEYNTEAVLYGWFYISTDPNGFHVLWIYDVLFSSEI